MTEKPDSYSPSTIETTFELLDKKLVSLGVPGALSFVSITKVREQKWVEAGWCLGAAIGVFVVIKVGKKLAPKLDQLLDWTIAGAERAIRNGFSTMRSDFEGQYLRKQARLCEEFISEGYTPPDRTTIPLLEEVFVPLDLSGALGDRMDLRQIEQLQKDPTLRSENLNIWDLLARSKRDRKFRQMSIQAKGGMGKTTLLRHIALIYGQRKQRRDVPKLIPILLRLRDWSDQLIQEKPPSLPRLINEFHVKSLFKDQFIAPPPMWAEKLLAKGSALVMFDGFDEVSEDKRKQVSRWLSAQMQEYPESIFMVTSRPAGFKDYVAQRPTIPIFVNKFSPKQQEQFVRRWYLCQERACRSEKQVRNAKDEAKSRADSLIAQLQQRREELGYMAENPLLLNMLTTFHRFDPAVELPGQRIELYRGICKLQLEDRPKARLIRMPLPFAKSQAILQLLALEMVKANRLKVPHQVLLKFLNQQPILQAEEVDAEDWLKKIVDISELLVERDLGEYEFPHASFQGFFAAAQLAKADSIKLQQDNARLVLKNWNGAIWRETVLLYTAQLTPKWLDQVIRKACEVDSLAAELATICVKEYPRPEKLSPELAALLQRLSDVAVDSKYQKLEEYLRNQQWKEADQETYRLMITTVGKEVGQSFEEEELLNFPCEELRAIDGLWVTYSKGHFGFSVQKKIYVECGAKLDGKYPGSEIWEAFGDRVGWREKGRLISYDPLTSKEISLSAHQGKFPVVTLRWVFGGVDGGDGVSLLAQRFMSCSTLQS
jgi:GUN4-like/NACHT domain